jgi:RNA ligase
MAEIAFEAWPKTPRLKGLGMIVTEKIDGTNAQVFIGEEGTVRAGSRNRWITPEDDNYGFAAWVAKHTEQLRALGPGRHFGEWWGCGIQRAYDLSERRFSLFNVGRWSNAESGRPKCCSVVPRLYAGAFDMEQVELQLAALREFGSHAEPGFPRPEGVIVYIPQMRQCFKRTIDERHKGSEGSCSL